jgi:hypothetical protein
MTEKRNGKAARDPVVYRRNRDAHSLEELARYGDQWVAWSADGRDIVAHHADPNVVWDEVKAKGLSSEDVVVEWIPPGGEVECLL